MQIQSINNFSNIKKNQNPTFKSVYPVVHWIAETNGSYTPELRKNIATKLNERIISMLNENSKEIINRNQPINKELNPSIFSGIDFPQRNFNLVFDYETYFPLQQINFEGVQIIVPRDIHTVLVQEFDNYMELPEDCYPRHVAFGAFDEKILDEFLADFETK